MIVWAFENATNALRSPYSPACFAVRALIVREPHLVVELARARDPEGPAVGCSDWLGGWLWHGNRLVTFRATSIAANLVPRGCDGL